MEDTFQLAKEIDEVCECKYSKNQNNKLNEKTKQITRWYTVTEENEPNFKVIAETLKILYEQGVRVKKP